MKSIHLREQIASFIVACERKRNYPGGKPKWELKLANGRRYLTDLDETDANYIHPPSHVGQTAVFTLSRRGRIVGMRWI